MLKYEEKAAMSPIPAKFGEQLKKSRKRRAPAWTWEQLQFSRPEYRPQSPMAVVNTSKRVNCEFDGIKSAPFPSLKKASSDCQLVKSEEALSSDDEITGFTGFPRLQGKTKT